MNNNKRLISVVGNKFVGNILLIFCLGILNQENDRKKKKKEKEKESGNDKK